MILLTPLPGDVSQTSQPRSGGHRNSNKIDMGRGEPIMDPASLERTAPTEVEHLERALKCVRWWYWTRRDGSTCTLNYYHTFCHIGHTT